MVSSSFDLYIEYGLSKRAFGTFFKMIWDNEEYKEIKDEDEIEEEERIKNEHLAAIVGEPKKNVPKKKLKPKATYNSQMKLSE